MSHKAQSAIKRQNSPLLPTPEMLNLFLLLNASNAMPVPRIADAMPADTPALQALHSNGLMAPMATAPIPLANALKKPTQTIESITEKDAFDVHYESAAGLVKGAPGPDPVAQHALGNYYANADDPTLHKMANSWYSKAGEKGHVPSKIALGQAFQFGKGTPVNIAKARQLYGEAAAAENSNGAVALAHLMEKGVDPKSRKAQIIREIYKAAAQDGHPFAQLRIQQMEAASATNALPALVPVKAANAKRTSVPTAEITHKDSLPIHSGFALRTTEIPFNRISADDITVDKISAKAPKFASTRPESFKMIVSDPSVFSLSGFESKRPSLSASSRSNSQDSILPAASTNPTKSKSNERLESFKMVVDDPAVFSLSGFEKPSNAAQ